MTLVVHGTYTTGFELSRPSDLPASVASNSTISSSGRYGIYGTDALAWHLVNRGLVSGSAYGVTFAASGTILNNVGGSPGTITGAVAGVSISGAGHVGNYGLIDATGAHGVGIVLGDGGSVKNGAHSGVSGTISGVRAGVELQQRAGLVANVGTIQATGTAGIGVLLAAGGTVTNGSSSAAGAISGARGVVLYGGGYVSNYGTITGDGGYGNYGVQVAGSGTITNGSHKLAYGVITGGVQLSSGFVGNYGLIDGASQHDRGIYATAVAGFVSINNAGTVTGIEAVRSAGTMRLVNGSNTNIQAVLTGRDFGAFSGGGGVAINFGTITSSIGVMMFGAGQQSLRVTNGSGLDTQATIKGSQVGVYLRFYGYAGGTGQIGLTNYGTIRGLSTGIVMADQGGGMTLINAGTIAASQGNGGVAVQFKGAGNAVLAVEPGSVFIGKVLASSTGGNILDFTSAATAGRVTGVGSQFLGFQNLWLDPGAQWTMAGSNTMAADGGITLHGQSTLTVNGRLAFAGQMNIAGTGVLQVASAGRLEVGNVGGAHAGVVTVDAGYALGGFGNIQSKVANDGTVVSSNTTLSLLGGLSGGIVEITSGSVLEASGTFAPQSIDFHFGSGTLQLASGVHTSAPIYDFGAHAGNGIELLGTDVTALSYATLSSSSGILTASVAGGGSVALHFSGGGYTSSQFHAANAAGGTATLITFG